MGNRGNLSIGYNPTVAVTILRLRLSNNAATNQMDGNLQGSSFTAR